MTKRDESASPRRGTNWHDARDFWLALDPPRSYEIVAQQYRVTGTRVRFVARRDNWADLAAEIDAKALASVKRRIVLSRTDRVAKTLGIVDGVLANLDENLDERVKEAKIVDLPGLVKLAELLEGEATDRVSIGEVQEVIRTVFLVAGRFVPKERRDEFKAELDRTLGGLQAVGGAS